MPLANYPASLPFDTRMNRMRPAPYRAPLVSEVEDGPVLIRVQSQTLIEQISYEINMDGHQFATWRDFVRVTLKQGTQHFLMTVPVPGTGYVARRVYLQDGMFQATEYGNGYTVNFILCVFPTT